MNAAQIEAILGRCHPKMQKHFLGCFPADRLPPKSDLHNFPSCMVINLDPARKEGSHWVAAIVTNPNTVLYWDSLAMAPKGKIADFLAEFGKKEWNKLAYQNPLTNTCGHFCITFLYYISILNYTYKKFLSLLNANSNPFADAFVQKFLNKLIQYSLW
jgi:hypothetical protein